MAEVTSATNSNGRDTDSVFQTTGVSGLHKLIIPGSSTSITGSATNGGIQRTGTHLDDAVFGIATDPITVIGGQADETSPDSVSEGDAGALRITLARNLHVVNVADAAAVTSVNSVATSTTLLAANANRIGATIHNSDANALFVKFGATATTTTSYTVKIASDGYYEFPAPVYRGIVDGIWAADGAGSAQITELT